MNWILWAGYIIVTRRDKYVILFTLLSINCSGNWVIIFVNRNSTTRFISPWYRECITIFHMKVIRFERRHLIKYLKFFYINCYIERYRYRYIFIINFFFLIQLYIFLIANSFQVVFNNAYEKYVRIKVYLYGYRWQMSKLISNLKIFLFDINKIFNIEV